jgi:hypothetical protein
MAFARIPHGVGWGGESALPEGSVESPRIPHEGGIRVLLRREDKKFPLRLTSSYRGFRRTSLI